MARKRNLLYFTGKSVPEKVVDMLLDLGVQFLFPVRFFGFCFSRFRYNKSLVIYEFLFWVWFG